jgi:dTDP-4-amino-4,6-dideoxygalactose transaminase
LPFIQQANDHGEGGLIVTDDENWANLFRSLRNQGRDIFDTWLNHSRLGYNYRLDEMSAALGLSQIGRLDELLNRRAQVAAWYNTRLQNEELIEVPHIVETTTRMSWFVYVVRIKPPASTRRSHARSASSWRAQPPVFHAHSPTAVLPGKVRLSPRRFPCD